MAGTNLYQLELDQTAVNCDVVQVSHHGIDNYDILIDLYAATHAKIALWPTPDYGMAERRSQTVNRFLLNDMNIAEHLCSGYGTVKLPLPYTLGSTEKLEKALSFERSPQTGQDTHVSGFSGDSFRYLTPAPVHPLGT